MTDKSKDLQYKVTFYSGPKRFVAVAWNYDIPALLASSDHKSYGDARAELQTLATERGLNLKWFDGEYTLSPSSSYEVPA